MGYIDAMSPMGYNLPMHLRRPKDLGDLIRERRKARNITQQELAALLGMSRKWVNELEQGNPSARIDIVFRALNELGVTLTPSANGQIIPERADATTGVIDIDEIADTGLE